MLLSKLKHVLPHTAGQRGRRVQLADAGTARAVAQRDCHVGVNVAVVVGEAAKEERLLGLPWVQGVELGGVRQQVAAVLLGGEVEDGNADVHVACRAEHKRA